MRDFHFTEQDAWDFPIIKARAYIAWTTLNNPWAAADFAGPGYIAKEPSPLSRFPPVQ